MTRSYVCYATHCNTLQHSYLALGLSHGTLGGRDENDEVALGNEAFCEACLLFDYCVCAGGIHLIYKTIQHVHIYILMHMCMYMMKSSVRRVCSLIIAFELGVST